MMGTLLVPLDGSAFGEAALPAALAIARRAHALLRLALVHEPVVVPAFTRPSPVLIDAPTAVPVPDPRLDADVRAQRRGYLISTAHRVAGHHGVHVKTALLDGPVAEALVTHAEQTGADVIVMSTHGRGGLSRLWLGSVAEDVVRRSGVPVVLVRPDHPGAEHAGGPIPPRGFRRVLVALDGSPLAEAVLEPALEVADADAEYVLLRVVEPITAIAVETLPGAVGTHADDAELGASEYLDSVAARLRARGLAVRPRRVTHTQVASTILDHARTIEADLIAMATHGHGGLRRLVLGSTAAKVLRGAETAVLLYRPPEQ